MASNALIDSLGMLYDKMSAKNWLSKAIQRHERHMSGKEPTTGGDGEISQKLMMEEMKYALKALDGEVSPTDWYTKNVKKFPQKMTNPLSDMAGMGGLLGR